MGPERLPCSKHSSLLDSLTVILLLARSASLHFLHSTSTAGWLLLVELQSERALSMGRTFCFHSHKFCRSVIGFLFAIRRDVLSFYSSEAHVHARYAPCLHF
ncbi:hypothetical protein MPTK1_3g02540 [Marchantia polymorpha subsp. ruderalis]|uniref:Secreted protein n=2 Tax=Marchantia polymorpha TaxID=3197 RepID=A0AAF6AWQ9_MARPO|nr:hypothetical protein MARPO_0007s0243 [Marchantia polymorpha]BBN04193.1 hypothetical protein Mp_3g02540 [Marchantia polymorpha subsp. ruderalis]|eukprot:PTQ47880.1 hypothetical protein MARPO_0007s0243 [Marchantia polymorpha]